MSKADEVRVAREIGSVLGIGLEARGLILNTWGKSECFARLGQHSYLVLEVETSQKHPTTNVAKLWPFLDENPATHIFLIHAYFQGSVGRESSRGRIAAWLGRKMEEILEERFRYFRIVVDGPDYDKQIRVLRQAVERFGKM